MKNIKYIIVSIATGLVMTLSSCQDFMDIEPTDAYSENMVFSDAALMQAYVYQLYRDIQHGAFEHTLDGLTDDAYFTHNYGQKAINEAAISESVVDMMYAVG